MAPRQRLSPPVSLDDVAASAVTSLIPVKGPLLSRRSSSSCGSNSSGSPASSDDEADHVPSSGIGSAPATRCSSAIKPRNIPEHRAAEAADIARERHDIFNLVALVRPPFGFDFGSFKDMIMGSVVPRVQCTFSHGLSVCVYHALSSLSWELQCVIGTLECCCVAMVRAKRGRVGTFTSTGRYVSLPLFRETSGLVILLRTL